MSDFDFLADRKKSSSSTGKGARKKGGKAATSSTASKKAAPREVTPKTEQLPKRPVGRPATGKRSDPNWVGRTYYIQSETDINLGVSLAQLKGNSLNVDRSELIDALLSDWLEKSQTEKVDWCQSRFS